MAEKTRIGIIGCGWIAEKMAITLQGMDNAEAYAISSRDKEKAEKFAKQWNFKRAYGSYEEMLDDPLVELVYIATPHSHHYEHTRLSLLKGKPVLCEKSFTANAQQAEEIIRLAEEKKLFLTEAIWTRYMPLSKTICDLVNNGAIGKPMMLSANLCYPNYDWERMHKPELAGGALLDLGVYALNFAAMIFGEDIVRTTSTCIKSPTGIDSQNSITLEYADGKMAVLHSSLLVKSDRQGIVSGDKGFLIVENINNPQSVSVYDENYQLKDTYTCPAQITGYEYQVQASIEAIKEGRLESPYMPHSETLRIMRQMDALRKEWNLVYPFEIQ